MPKAQIVYASWTGNSKKIAVSLARFLEEQQVETAVYECQQTDASEFLKADICIVSTYTYGSQGDLPDEIVDFYYDLGGLDLSGKIYGVLGSGEKIYDFYCKSVDDFDRQFKKTGAVQGAAPLKIEAGPNENDLKNIRIFSKDILESFEKLNR